MPEAEAEAGAAPRPYALIDAGDGRRLERFGSLIVDRPAPQARGARLAPARWARADARFERGSGWSGAATEATAPPQPWAIELGGLTFHLRLTDSGQVGVFPEQAPNWAWIEERIAEHARRRPREAPRLRALHLFAHTGGATLAAAAAGAQVVHVDAARSTLAWARENAAASGLADAPIRWIPDDAARFAEREVRRGRDYDLVVLDPPSYGHGPGGERWSLVERLPGLLTICARLLTPRPIGVLLSAHTTGLEPADLAAFLRGALGSRGRIEAVPLTLVAESGAPLACGAAARWSP